MSPVLLTTGSPSDQRKAVMKAVDVLTRGGIVGLPMETVYGLAAWLTQPPAIERLKKIKNIRGHPGWVIHVAQASQARLYIREMPTMAARIMKKCWPGPVAIQMRASAGEQSSLGMLIEPAVAGEIISDGWITFRCPDQPVTREILADLPGPTAMIGAGELQPAGEVGDIPARILDQLDAVVDAGPARYRKSSTIVRVAGDQLQIVRPGVIEERIINRLAEEVIVFICTGNTCRSPMAAAIAGAWLARKLGIAPAALPQHHVVVESAGLHATDGMPATTEARTAARERGADLTTHRSRAVTVDLLQRADVIYTMTQSHRDELLERYPAVADKTFTLDPDADIADPIGSEVGRYRELAKRLEALIAQRLSGIVP